MLENKILLLKRKDTSDRIENAVKIGVAKIGSMKLKITIFRTIGWKLKNIN